MEEYLRSGNVQDALSSFREQKIPDRFVRYVLLAIMTQTLDKNGNYQQKDPCRQLGNMSENVKRCNRSIIWL
jgi:hypothetical protein